MVERLRLPPCGFAPGYVCHGQTTRVPTAYPDGWPSGCVNQPAVAYPTARSHHAGGRVGVSEESTGSHGTPRPWRFTPCQDLSVIAVSGSVRQRRRRPSLGEERARESGKNLVCEMDREDDDDRTEKQTIPAERKRTEEVPEEDESHVDTAP